jgi:uncharacterized membrane protein
VVNYVTDGPQIGDVVEVKSFQHYGKVGTIMDVVVIFPSVTRLTVKLDPVKSVSGDVYDLGSVSLYLGQVRVLTELEQLARAW